MKVLLIMISLLPVFKSQKNLSPDGTPSQSSVYYWKDRKVNMTADLAISGGPNDDFGSVACSVTLANPIQYVAWWMVTFPLDTVYITKVKFYYRKNTPSRLAGYYMYVSNSSTTKNDGYLCYHHEGPGLPPVTQNVNCNYLGQHVIFYNERNENKTYPPEYTSFAIVELCYIEINGCYKGRWGTGCSKSCPVNCISGHCHPGNGSCVWGCKPDNCLNDICNTDTGVCTNGCQLGLFGDSCDKSCPSGTYGVSCDSLCDTCVNKVCERFDGNCTYGCIEGFKGHNCQLTATPQSDDTTTYTTIYTGVGAAAVTTVICVIIFMVILRYTRHRRDGSTPQHNGHTRGEFRNSALTDDDAKTGADKADAHYEDIKPPVQENWYDETKPPVQNNWYTELAPPVPDRGYDDIKPPVQDKRHNDAKSPVQDDLYIDPTPPVQDDQCYNETTPPVQDNVYQSIDEDV